MNLDEYQALAAKTNQKPGNTIIPLLGLAGEAGALLSEYKKLLRDGPAHRHFRDQLAEELGDLLWYIAAIASEHNLHLSEIARQNLQKTADRWGAIPDSPVIDLDADDPEADRLPREFRVDFVTRESDDRMRVCMIFEGIGDVGDPLTDNAYRDDGYRYHDIIHLAFAATLGWSPTLRRLLRRKRKTTNRPLKDEVEDGARAGAIEEAIATVIGEYAVRHNFLEGTSAVDWDVLQFARRMTATLDVRIRTVREWEYAIVSAIRVWKQLYDAGGGRVYGSLYTRTLTYEARPG